MKKKGLTLIELLLTIGLSAIIFTIASSVIMGLSRRDLTSRRQEIFEQVKNDVQSELVNSIKWAEEINLQDSNSDGTIDIIIVDAKTIKLENYRITRDGTPITPDSVRITKFQINELGPGDDNVSLRITVEMQSVQNSSVKDSFIIVASKRSTEITE